ncbi:MAG: CRISPR-associated endonuclease Cas2 [Bacteroidetes bacterium]|nr:MAG: CRISPR-associated endonuclease Cas2 [Bacteroidota bacterium]
MIRLLVYDISQNRTRSRLARELEAIGMMRIQKSVFLGNPRPKVLKDLLRRSRAELQEGDRLYCIPVTEAQVEGLGEQGLTEDLDLILGRRHSLIL